MIRSIVGAAGLVLLGHAFGVEGNTWWLFMIGGGLIYTGLRPDVR